jgi:hypothetical protein
LAVAAALGACASISGLNEFSNDTCNFCSDDGGASVAVAPDTSSEVVEENDGIDVEIPEATPEQPPSDGTDGVEEDAARDARNTASDAPPDVSSEAATCSQASCDGCCTTAGLCAAGGLNNACGVAGSPCQECSSGLVCGASGSCTSPPVDAGTMPPPGCNPSTCTNLCVPYFIQCCKSDETCGCALLFPRGSCM